ncbi:hypothetical protein WB334_25170, partial [Escherichia coli]|uniref:hypothetical protein n=1 Tax=Escherichia coli TaxID=562 RepID=UPI0021581AED
MIGQVFLRGVPAALQAGVESGAFGVYGSVIRDCATGQIRGYLQETGLLGRLAGMAYDGAVPR